MEEIFNNRNEIEALGYLPIGWFKEKLNFINHLIPGQTAMTFNSSGTTTEGHSESPFSKEGLDVYKLRAVSEFIKWLRTCGIDPYSSRGISLIPPFDPMNPSSLGFMASALAQELAAKSIEAIPVEWYHTGADSQKKVWIFGRALDFLNLIDCAVKIPRLPAGSVIIETGGMKNSSLAVSKRTLHSRILDYFNCPDLTITSEFGMCELASQAYCVEVGSSQYSRERFRFPTDCQVWIDNGSGVKKRRGIGAMVVKDPARIDIPHPIATDDIIDLADDQSFRFIGRKRYSIPKGCSLGVKLHSKSQSRGSGRISIVSYLHQSTRDRSVGLFEVLEDILNTDELRQSLVREFGQFAGAWALEDLKRSVPQSPEGIKQITYHSRRNCSHLHKKWIILLPKNHSLVGWEPIIVGVSLGLDLSVRIPASMQGTSISLLIKKINQVFPRSIKILANSFRLESQCPSAILAFGKDSTVQKFQSQWRVNRFGTINSFLRLKPFDIRKNADTVVRHCLTLKQRGCLVPRVILLESESIPKNELQLVLRSLIDVVHCPPYSLESGSLEERISAQRLRKLYQCRDTLHDISLAGLTTCISFHNLRGFKLIDQDCASIQVLIGPVKDEEMQHLGLNNQVELGKTATPWSGQHLGKFFFGN